MAEKTPKKTVETADLEELKAQIIREAKAEARKIIAEAKEQAEAGTSKKKKEMTEEQKANAREAEELVTVRLPMIKNEGPVYVAVNGDNVLIPRGKEVQIKKKFYWVLQSSELQSESAMRLIQGLADDYNAKSNNY